MLRVLQMLVMFHLENTLRLSPNVNLSGETNGHQQSVGKKCFRMTDIEGKREFFVHVHCH